MDNATPILEDREGSIWYQTSELRGMAQYLKQNIDDGLQMRVNSILANLSTVWVGKDADEFANKVKDLVRKIQSIKEQNYLDMAFKLERSADDLENTTNELAKSISNF